MSGLLQRKTRPRHDVDICCSPRIMWLAKPLISGNMPVSAEYRTFVLEQLSSVKPVTARAMFGGVGIYSGDLFFALIASDTLYFKVDAVNRSDYESRGMKPFMPYGNSRQVMQYYQVPADVLEDVDALRRWMERAIGVARAKRVTPKKRK